MQEDDKILKVVMRVLMSILVIVFITIIIKFFAKNVLIDIMHIDNNFLRKIAGETESNTHSSVDIDWQEEYPYEENNSKANAEEKNIVSKYLNTINNLKNQIKNYSSEYLYNYEKIVEIAKLYENIINWDLITLTDNNTPIEIGEEIWSEVRSKESYTDISNNIIEFNVFLKKSEIELLYVQAPAKIENTTSGGTLNTIKDYLKENTDNFIDSLEKNNINVLDLREKMKDDGLDYKDAFFRTDHHWTPKTGIWATNQIAIKMNDLWNMNINDDLYDIENYDTQRFEKIYLGSQGRRVTLAKAKPEDFDIIFPIFETNISIKVPNLDIDKTGDFRETLIYEDYINEDYYNAPVYSTYEYGDKAVKIIKNNLVNDNERVLVLKDSFADVVTPYLSLGLNTVYEVDLRYFNGSIKNFIEKNDITKAVMLYYSGSLYDDKGLFEYK